MTITINNVTSDNTINAAEATAGVSIGGTINDTSAFWVASSVTVEVKINQAGIDPTVLSFNVPVSGGVWTLSAAQAAQVAALSNNDNYYLTASASGQIFDSSPRYFSVDKTGPADHHVTITSVYDDASPTIGDVANNGSTNDTTPTIKGTIDNPGAGNSRTVAVYTSTGVYVGEATVNGSSSGATKSWSVTSSTLAAGDYTFVARERDSDGNFGADSNSHKITITAANTAPTDISLAGGSVAENATGALVGTLSATDAQGGAMTYTITDASSPFEIVNGTELRVKAGTALNYEATSSYTVNVQVKDSGNLTFSKPLTVSVTDVNEFAPAFAGGATKTFTIAENTTAVGSVGATDADGTATVTYSLVAGGDAAAFSINATTGALTLNTAGNYESKTSYNLTVQASDGSKTATQNVTVNLTDVNEFTPVFVDGAAKTITIAENTTAAGSVSAIDVDGTATVTYSLVAGGDAAAFTINTTTGALTLNTAGDYETKSSYNLTVQASDGTKTATENVTVLLSDVNEFAPSITSTATFTVSENNGTSVGTVVATDADGTAVNNTVAYSLEGADAALFTINPATGVLTLNAAADYEAKSTYSLTVKASDGTKFSTQDITVNVTDLNDVAPVIGSAATTPSVAENTATTTVVFDGAATDGDGTAPNNTVTYSLTGVDAGKFDISSTGKVTFKASPDFEAKADAGGDNVYNITVHANDGVHDTTKDVVVSLTDVNDLTPSITSAATFTVAENNGTAVGTVVATDADGTAANNTVSYSISGGADAGLFTIDAATGVLTLNAAANYEAKSSYSLTVKASDGSLFSTQNVTVNVTDSNDNAPVFTSAGTASAAENTTSATVVYTAATTDADGTAANRGVAYSLEGADAGKFNIDSVTGAVTFKAAPNYEAPTDAGANNVYDVVVKATNVGTDGTQTTTKNVAISVTDVNDNTPVITSAATASFAENGTGQAYKVVATDADASPAFNTVTYSIEAGGDGALFNINATTGVVTFKSAPNFEAPADSDKDNNYVLLVKASDGTFSSTKSVVLSVTNVFEPGEVASGVVITSTDGLIKDASPLITGVANTSLAGQTVTVFEGATARGTGVVQANGSWSIETGSVADGAHTYTAQLAGNVSNSVTLTIDTVAPTVTITGTTGTGFSPTVTGTASVADVGRTVSILDGTTVVGTGTVGAGGAFSVTTGLTGSGAHSLTAQVIDLAGNVGTSSATAYNIAPQPSQGQLDAANLTTAYVNIMDGPISAKDGVFMEDLLSKLSLNLVTYKEALDQVIDRADGTTSVATLSYQFFTGKIPSKAGMDYLLTTTGGNTNNLNSAYYQDFNIENRYINFAVNLGHDGEGKAAFQTKYGALSLFDATKKAYTEIFGTAATDAKVHDLLDTTMVFGGKTITRADYFANYGHDAIGTKAAMVGWLLSEAAKADVGAYATANEAFLNDLADGATFNVDLVGVYGTHSAPVEVLG